MKVFVILLVLVGFVGFAFATHDPDQPYTHSIILPQDIHEKTFEEFMDWCVPFYGEKCTKLYHGTSTLPPLKQFQSGITFDEIQCKQNLVLVQKYDGSPACVTESTKQNLIERGWAKETIETDSKISSHYNPVNSDCTSIEDVKKITYFNIQLPRYLPSNYVLAECQGTSFEAQILYHDNDLISYEESLIGNSHRYVAEGAIYLYVLDEETFVGQEQFLEEKGNTDDSIILQYESAKKVNPSINLQIIEVGGNKALMTKSCEDCGMQTATFTNETQITTSSGVPNRIKFYDGGILYNYETNAPLSELLKVVQSKFNVNLEIDTKK